MGFAVGAALVVPGVYVALLVPAVELVWPFLTPGAAVLRPLPLDTASRPGAVSLLLLATVNGVVLGTAAAAAAGLLGRARRRAS